MSQSFSTGFFGSLGEPFHGIPGIGYSIRRVPPLIRPGTPGPAVLRVLDWEPGIRDPPVPHGRAAGHPTDSGGLRPEGDREVVINGVMAYVGGRPAGREEGRRQWQGESTAAVGRATPAGDQKERGQGSINKNMGPAAGRRATRC